MSESESILKLEQQSIAMRHYDPKRSYELAIEVLESSEKSHYHYGIAVGLIAKSQYTIGNDFVQAMSEIEGAISIMEEEPPTEFLAQGYSAQFYAYYLIGEYEQCLASLERSLSLSLKHGYLQQAVTALKNLGAIAAEASLNRLAYEFYLKAEELADNLDSPYSHHRLQLSICGILNSFAMSDEVLKRLGRIDVSYSWNFEHWKQKLVAEALRLKLDLTGARLALRNAFALIRSHETEVSSLQRTLWLSDLFSQYGLIESSDKEIQKSIRAFRIAFRYANRAKSAPKVLRDLERLSNGYIQSNQIDRFRKTAQFMSEVESGESEFSAFQTEFDESFPEVWFDRKVQWIGHPALIERMCKIATNHGMAIGDPFDQDAYSYHDFISHCLRIQLRLEGKEKIALALVKVDAKNFSEVWTLAHAISPFIRKGDAVSAFGLDRIAICFDRILDPQSEQVPERLSVLLASCINQDFTHRCQFVDRHQRIHSALSEMTNELFPETRYPESIRELVT